MKGRPSSDELKALADEIKATTNRVPGGPEQTDDEYGFNPSCFVLILLVIAFLILWLATY